MEFLLELRTEELPASHIRSALEQLDEKFRLELGGAGIGITKLETLGTPRRLIVVGDFAAGLEDQEELVTGPPKSVGLGSDGAFTQAARGFARSHSLPESTLEVIRTQKGEYLGFRRTRKGKSTSEILVDIVPKILASLSFPKAMRWSEGSIRFSRPIHGFLVLFDGKPLDVDFWGFRASDETVGHRVLGAVRIKVSSFGEYRDLLRNSAVIIDPGERRESILGQIAEKLIPLGAAVHPDPDLLEELTYNVECPLVVLGHFPENYLGLPLEVLSTAMRSGQKLFSVVKDKKQLPYFLGVADARSDIKGLILKGNERVLKARLDDAKFFWDQDRKTSLAKTAEGLRKVVFQESLGSYEDKCQRLKKIVAYLCDKTGADRIKRDVVEAAGLCKVDLLTEMVKEFPSLQGKMGGLLARQEGYPAALAAAVYEHYRPASLEDESPSSLGGSILSIADKLDSIVGVVGIGVEVSGSSDPFGLRRNAHGVCKTALDRKLRFPFGRVLDKVLIAYGDSLSRGKAEVKAYCLEFFRGRLRFILDRSGFRYDLVSAALGPGIEEIGFVLLRAQALDSLKSSPLFEPFILMAKRINNIIRGFPPYKVNPDLFEEKEERELHSTFMIIRDNALSMIAKGDFVRAQSMIFKIQPVLYVFFDKVLVMAEDKRLRKNRLGMLQEIHKMLGEMADYSQVVVEGEKPSGPGPTD